MQIHPQPPHMTKHSAYTKHKTTNFMSSTEQQNLAKFLQLAKIYIATGDKDVLEDFCESAKTFIVKHMLEATTDDTIDGTPILIVKNKPIADHVEFLMRLRIGAWKTKYPELSQALYHALQHASLVKKKYVKTHDICLSHPHTHTSHNIYRKYKDVLSRELHEYMS